MKNKILSDTVNGYAGFSECFFCPIKAAYHNETNREKKAKED